MDAVDVGAMLVGFLAVDAVLLVLAVPVWLGLRWLKRRYLGASPQTSYRAWARTFLIGLVVGAVSLFAVVSPAVIAGSFAPGHDAEDFEYRFESWDGALVVATFVLLFQSLSEELAFRAVAMGLLAGIFFLVPAWLLDRRERRRGDPEPGGHRLHLGWLWLVCGTAANLVFSLLFSFVHMDNPNVTSLAAVNIGLISVALGQLFWVQGSVMGAWSFHWVWNAGLAVVGLPVSGIALFEPAQGFGFSAARPDVWSGGGFGPEGSVLCTVVATVLVVVLFMVSVRTVRRTTGRCADRLLWLNALRRRRGSPSTPDAR